MGLDVEYEIGSKIEHLLSFEDDGYYWYLYPLFEKLYKSTGSYIDRYGDCEFNKGSINQFNTLVREAKKMLENQPNKWAVHCGTQTQPVKKEIYHKISKTELLKRLEILLVAINKIKENGGKLVFTGD